MGFFDIFRSKEGKLRHRIRKGFDECVNNAVDKSNMDDSMMLGLLVQAAISTYYQSLKQNSILWLIADQAGVDYDKVLDEECKRALNKYLKY